MAENTTLEQQSRDLLERAGVEDAQSFTAGDLVEIANLLGRVAALAAPVEPVALSDVDIMQICLDTEIDAGGIPMMNMLRGEVVIGDFRDRLLLLIRAVLAAQPAPAPDAKCDGGTCGLGGYCADCPKQQPAPAVPTPEDGDRVEAAIDEYVDFYIMEGDGCHHQPDDGERAMIKDAIMGLLVDPGFIAAYDAAAPGSAPAAPAVRDVTPQEDAALRSAARRGAKIIRPAPAVREPAIKKPIGDQAAMDTSSAATAMTAGSRAINGALPLGRDAVREPHEPYLCIKPACGPDCSGCNCAISPQDMRDYAVRYAILRNAPIDAIRAGGVFAGKTPDNVVLNGEHLDAAVDALRGITGDSNG